ncbi:hypothetical protein BH10PSE4_BH10PSE4_48080 [soil metagenome]
MGPSSVGDEVWSLGRQVVSAPPFVAFGRRIFCLYSLYRVAERGAARFASACGRRGRVAWAVRDDDRVGSCCYGPGPGERPRRPWPSPVALCPCRGPARRLSPRRASPGRPAVGGLAADPGIGGSAWRANLRARSPRRTPDPGRRGVRAGCPGRRGRVGPCRRSRSRSRSRRPRDLAHRRAGRSGRRRDARGPSPPSGGRASGGCRHCGGRRPRPRSGAKPWSARSRLPVGRATFSCVELGVAGARDGRCPGRRFPGRGVVPDLARTRRSTPAGRSADRRGCL